MKTLMLVSAISVFAAPMSFGRELNERFALKANGAQTVAAQHCDHCKDCNDDCCDECPDCDGDCC